MPTMVQRQSSRRSVLLPDPNGETAKASIRKTDSEAVGDGIWRAEAGGRAIERTRALSGLLLKEFAARIRKDERTVSRWISAEERPQIDLIFAVDDFRALLVIALAEVAGVEVTTQITVRRRA
jgi:ribosome-binding protein aMBF1 (putative translation factor)